METAVETVKQTAWNKMGIFVVIGLCVLAFFGYVFSGMFGSVAKKEEAEPELSEEEKQMLIIEQRQREKEQLRAHAEEYKAKLSQIMNEIQQNQAEAAKNFTGYQKLFGTKKASFDDNLTAMEDEQNIDTIFMVKDDIDKKKAGMVNLGKELGLQYQNLKQEQMSTHDYLLKLNNQWMYLYPEEQPIYYDPGATPPNSPSPMTEQARENRERNIAAQHQHQFSKFTGDPVLSNDKGREQLPFS